jgi:hypothetical protein
VGCAAAVAWTIVGCLIALVQDRGAIREFLESWYRLQGFFLIAIGTWLILLIRSGSWAKRLAAVLQTNQLPPVGIVDRRLRFLIIGAVTCIGTTSILLMGFDATGMLMAFMWITAACVCFTAGATTLHAVDIILSMHRLQDCEIKAFRYAPARTREIRDVVGYFSSFSLLTTVGYAFALFATLEPKWMGNPDYVSAVRVFWPILYVPTCSIALIYPHVIVHRLIDREKERTLSSYQAEIDQLLLNYRSLNPADVEKTNALAQLFDRISATPNYVVDFGTGVRTLLPIVFNLASLFVKGALSHG